MPIRGAELTPQLRSRICELRSIGYSYSQIAKVHPEVKRSTIISTCRRESLRDDNKSLKRTGAPRKLSAEQRDHLYDLVFLQNTQMKPSELLEEVDNVISERTLRHLLKDMGRSETTKKPWNSTIRATARLEWAQIHARLASKIQAMDDQTRVTLNKDAILS